MRRRLDHDLSRVALNEGKDKTDKGIKFSFTSAHIEILKKEWEICRNIGKWRQGT